MAIRLYHRWKCPWCAAARQGAENVEMPLELVEVPRPRLERTELMAVSGQDRVPVLVDGDTVVVGSRRIVRHLYATYGGDDLRPSAGDLDEEIAALEAAGLE
jgi:glutathione S-transferase